MRSTCWVTSDVHLGAGGALDRFRLGGDFVAWVDEMHARDTVLVVNGDFIDFDKIEPLAIEATLPRWLLWTEQWSMQKLKRSVRAHADVFDSLQRFVESGGEIRITIGNHDLDLQWPAIQEMLRVRLGGDGESVKFFLEGTEFEGVRIQHGHEFTRENALRCPPSAIHAGPEGLQYLERLWGTDFVVSFGNPTHHELWFLENLEPSLETVMNALRNRWFSLHHASLLLRFAMRARVPTRSSESGAAGERVARSPVERERNAARVILGGNVRHVVLGHTHFPVDGMEVLPGKLLFNPGSWLPVLDRGRHDVVSAARNLGLSRAFMENSQNYVSRGRAVRISAGSPRPEMVRLS